MRAEKQTHELAQPPNKAYQLDLNPDAPGVFRLAVDGEETADLTFRATPLELSAGLNSVIENEEMTGVDNLTIGGKLTFHIIFTGAAPPDLQMITEGNGNHVLTPIDNANPRSGPAAPGLDGEARTDAGEAAALAQCAVRGGMFAMQILEWEGLKKVTDFLEGVSDNRMENIQAMAKWIDPDCGDLAMAFAGGAFDALIWKLGGVKPDIPKLPHNPARDDFETDAVSAIIAMLQQSGANLADLEVLAKAYHADAPDGNNATH